VPPVRKPGRSPALPANAVLPPGVQKTALAGGVRGAVYNIASGGREGIIPSRTLPDGKAG